MTATTAHPSGHLEPTVVVPLSNPPVRRVLAVAIVGAPLLVAINSVFHPEVELSGASLLAGAQSDPGTWFTVHVVAALGAMLGVPAALGLRTLARDRGHRFVTVGTVLAVVGSPILAMAFVAEASVLRLATGIDPAAAASLAEAYTRTPEFYAVGVAVVLTTLGSLLIALGLLVGRAVPRPLVVAYLLANVATTAAVPGSPLGPIAFGAIALVSAGFARQVMRQGAEAGTGPSATTR